MKIKHFIHAYLPGFKKRIIYITVLFLLVSCGGPRSYMNPKADFTFIKKVAILPFVNLTNDKFAGDKVRDIVTTEVLSRGFFDVVEWGEVSRVLGEESKGLSTEIDKETAKRIGKRLQIQAIILGTVEEYGTSRGGGRSSPEVAISIRMIDINSSKILWQASYDKKGGGVISRLFGVGEKSISEVARKLVKEVLDTLFGSGQQKQEKEEE